MIALDTSSVVAFLEGASGTDVDAVDDALADAHALLPPVVLTELLSSVRLRPVVAVTFEALPRVQLRDGYWERTGKLRADILRRGNKSRLADALIAQACIDANVPLITRDRDFRHYVTHGLRLV